MHDMSSIILNFPEGTAVPRPRLYGSGDIAAQGCEGPGYENRRLEGRGHEGEANLARRQASVRAQIGFMRARGMSNTGIRRTLGLSEREAVKAGIIPSRIEAGRKDKMPAPDTAPNDTGDDDSQGGPSGGRGGPRMVAVLAAVAQAGKVGEDEIVGAGQGRRLTPLRQLTMYLLRELCEGASLPAIGHCLTRDHTTVHHGCRKAKNLLLSDPDFRLLYDDVRASLAAQAATADG